MKKIFTLLVSVTMFASAFAQYGRDDQRNQGYDKQRDVVYNDGRYKNDNDRYSFSKREMDMQIAQINRDYDRRIMDVKNRFFMPRFKKEQIICRLEEQRKDEIRNVYAKFSDRRNRHDDDDHRRNW